MNRNITTKQNSELKNVIIKCATYHNRSATSLL